MSSITTYNDAFIQAISYYLPEKVLDNQRLKQDFPEGAIDKVADKTGILSRHIAENSECASDLAVKAANKLFLDYKISPSTIDFVLFCTQSPDYFLPTTACIIQERLGLSTKIGALDFNLGCSGFVYGLSIAKGLIAANMAQNVLLLTGETYSKYMANDDKTNRVLFGDAGAATLVSVQKGVANIRNFVFGTDGRGANNLIVEQGGARTFGSLSSTTPTLYMNGPEIFNFTLETVPMLVTQVLEKNDVQLDDINCFVFHQANQFMLESLRRILKIPEHKFLIHLKECGNTVSSTIPIVLYEGLSAGKIKKGDRVLIIGFGVGYSWSGTLLEF